MKLALLLLSLPVVVIGCSSSPAVQTGPDAEMTFDGLTRIDNSVANLAWMRADIDLSHYRKIILENAGVEFRPVTGPISGSPAAARPESGSSATSSVPTQGEFALSDDQKAKLVGHIPLGRMGTAGDIAAGVLYLASAEGAYITGQTLHINGGMAMI